MAISNTNILIKRSLTTGKPASLNQAELAYSYASNTLFIGSPAGSGTLNVGGQFYTTTVDAATSSNTASTLVKRDVNGAISGRFYGVSNTAVALDTTQNFSITGDVLAPTVSFNGTGAVALAAALNTINPNVGTFGGTTSVPVITVAANGRITSVTTSPISAGGGGSSFLTISDGTTSNTINIAQNTFYHKGLGGLVPTVSGNTITYNTDNTVLRSNTTGVGPQVIQTDLTVTGNLIVQGNTTSVQVSSLNISDPVIYLAANNYYGDTVDIGFAGNYFDGTNQRHTGLFRNPTNKQFYLFDNYLPELSSNNNIDTANASFRLATITANVTGGKIYGLANTIGIVDGGTNNSTFTNNQLTYYNGIGIVSLANTGTAGSYANSNTIPVITTDGFGRVSSIVNTAIAITAAQVTSGQLAIAQGGTNNNTYTPNQITFYNGTAIVSLANSSFANTGTAGPADTITSLTVDGFGRTTAVGYVPIAIAASQVTSGQLAIAQGGTNNSTFTQNQLTFFNGTSIVSLANTGTAGSYANSNTIPVITTDGFGRVSSIANTAIAGLTVPQGGTGVSTFTTSGVLYGNGTGALQATALAGSGDQTYSNQILTVNATGVPVWSTAMDGGQF